MTLPNFLIIGAMKSGTSSLHQALRAHPQVFMPVRKELHFFTSPHIPWSQLTPDSRQAILHLYASFFRDAQPFEIATGEATTTYLSTPGVAIRIHQALPGAKLICILRNPVDRAYSHFYHQLRRGEESCVSFEQAIQRERSEYAELGRYAHHLSPYFEHFAPHQILVLLFEDLLHTPALALQRVFKFLGLPPTESLQLPHKNAGWAPAFPKLNQCLIAQNPAIPLFQWFLPKNAPKVKRLPPRVRQFIMKRIGSRTIPPLSPQLRAQVFELFQADITRLESLLQRDLSQWTQVSNSGDYSSVSPLTP